MSRFMEEMSRRRRRENISFAVWFALCLPGILSASSSSKSNFSRTLKVSSHDSLQNGRTECVHGFCTEADICECNPCWSGPTCQDYVDRFSPRFLAEEPFFILNYEKLQESSSSSRLLRSSSSSFRSSSSKFPSPLPNTKSYYSNDRVRVPLFRIESSDDDLGLTCQLGEVGPSATCPCATPRYAVIGPTESMFYTDPETGDVFLLDGHQLSPHQHYFITLQVSALEVKDAKFQRNWKEEIRATLYVRPSADSGEDEQVTKILLESLKSNESQMEKEAMDDQQDQQDQQEEDEDDDYSSLSPEEAQDLYQARFLPKRRESKSDSIFRYKRQITREGDGRVRISSFPSNGSQLELLNPGDRIKIGIQIELFNSPLPPPSSAFPLLNLSVEISTAVQSKNVGISICSADIIQGGSSINPTPPFFTSSNNGDQNTPDTVTWNLGNIKKIQTGGEKRKEKDEIHLDLLLCLTSSTSTLPLPNLYEPKTPPPPPPIEDELRVEVQISFPLEKEPTKTSVIKGRGGRGSRAQKIKTLIQFPITRRGNPKIPVVPGQSGEEQERKVPIPTNPISTTHHTKKKIGAGEKKKQRIMRTRLETY